MAMTVSVILPHIVITHQILRLPSRSDDMPPLVENPYPSMTFTFAANMTPITYSTDPMSIDATQEQVFPSFAISSEPSTPQLETRTSHHKKKDANHIPRPPNAFILFRSSFVKAQHIPEKIEGNHSALSKIIGTRHNFLNCDIPPNRHASLL